MARDAHADVGLAWQGVALYLEAFALATHAVLCPREVARDAARVAMPVVKSVGLAALEVAGTQVLAAVQTGVEITTFASDLVRGMTSRLYEQFGPAEDDTTEA